MNLNKYQEIAKKFMLNRLEGNINYFAFGLGGETGEVLEKLKKQIRDHDSVFDEDFRIKIAKELGDVLWYLTAIAGFFEFSLNEIAAINIAKLISRQKRNVLKGDGDNR